MLHLHIAFSLGLLALVAGTFLFIWSKHVHTAGGCCWLGKIIGLIVMILALIMTICSIVCGVNMMIHHGYGQMSMPAALTSAMSTSSTSSVDSPSTATTPARHR